MLRKGQEGHVRAERDILKSASLVHSPGGAEWIVRLYYSFQDRDNLYLVSFRCILFPSLTWKFLILISFHLFIISVYFQVLEYMGGGDLLNLLIERDAFEEDFTRFYVAEASLPPG
jgi:protein-serine/threonine kinase